MNPLGHSLAALTILVPVVSAQSPCHELGPPDLGPNTGFGAVVDVSGPLVAVGASAAPVNGPGSGAVFVFDATTGAELAQLTPIDPGTFDGFGFSIDLEGTLAVIGAQPLGTTSPGRAFLFDVVTAKQRFELLPSSSSGQDGFGASVALGGGRIVVGAPSSDELGFKKGAAFVFDMTGAESAKLVSDDPSVSAFFGSHVAIDGDIAAVSARSSVGAGGGLFFVFDLTTGALLHRIVPGDGVGVATDLALSGNRLLVGASRDDDVAFNSGAGWVFDVATGELVTKLLAEDGSESDWLGEAVTLVGNRAIVGATRHGSAGAVYVFDATTGEQLAKTSAPPGLVAADFGQSLGADLRRLVIGTPGKGPLFQATGAAFVFGTCAVDESWLPIDSSARLAIPGSTGP